MITEYGIEAKSNKEIISELGGRFKEYRLFSNLTQKEVAVKSGVSIFTIRQYRLWHYLVIAEEYWFYCRGRKVAAPIANIAYSNSKGKRQERKGKT